MLYLYPIIGFWGFFNFGEVAECVLLKTEGEETTSKLNPHQFAAIFTVATKKYLRAFFHNFGVDDEVCLNDKK